MGAVEGTTPDVGVGMVAAGDAAGVKCNWRRGVGSAASGGVVGCGAETLLPTGTFLTRLTKRMTTMGWDSFLTCVVVPTAAGVSSPTATHG
jgi:hypothetical protein